MENATDYIVTVDSHEQGYDSPAIVRSLTGESLSYETTGRPMISSGKDISISHKGPVFWFSLITPPYLVGIDVEDVCEEIHEDAFTHYFLQNEEEEALNAFCTRYGSTKKEGLIAFWSIKEAFMKCIKYTKITTDLITIQGIDASGIVSIKVGTKIEAYMEESNISIISLSLLRKNNNYLSKCIARYSL